MTDRYILVGQTPVPCEDLIEWATWFEDSDARRVALTEVGPYTVSTVFLGLDHGWRHSMPGHENDAPVLFETMAWITASRAAGDPVKTEWAEIQERCSTWIEAELQHKAVVAQLQQPGDSVVDLLEAKI